MNPDVPYLSKQHIEREANILLAEYGREHGPVVIPPVPVDEILELHLGLTLEMDDLRGQFGGAEVLGALWFNDKRVVIDQHLDPETNPEKEGRFNFTCGHEGAHWWLHRPYFTEGADQGELFGAEEGKPSHVCRRVDEKARIEWQADYFASHLTMPRTLVLQVWKDQFGHVEPVVYEDCKRLPIAQPYRRKGLQPLRHLLSQAFSPEAPLFNRVAKEFADVFKVSTLAMRICLEEMGLLVRSRSECAPLFRAAR